MSVIIVCDSKESYPCQQEGDLCSNLKGMIEAEEQIEQQKAIDKVTNAQQTLMSVLHHNDIPLDITDECEGVDKCYRNYYVDDLQAEIRTAFLAWKVNMDLQLKWDLYKSRAPRLGILVDADGAEVLTSIELQRISNMQTLDIDFEIGQPVAHKLSVMVHKQLDKEVYDRVDIAFKSRG